MRGKKSVRFNGIDGVVVELTTIEYGDGSGVKLPVAHIEHGCEHASHGKCCHSWREDGPNASCEHLKKVVGSDVCTNHNAIQALTKQGGQYPQNNADLYALVYFLALGVVLWFISTYNPMLWVLVLGSGAYLAYVHFWPEKPTID